MMIFLETIRTFLSEFSILVNHFNIVEENQNLFSPILIKKLLFQLNECIHTLELKDFKPLVLKIKKLLEANASIELYGPTIDRIKSTIEEYGILLNILSETMDNNENLKAIRLKGARILVSEDIKTSQLYLKKILISEGASVVLADDGDECLRKYSENGPFDLILMDIFMPGLSGVEVTKILRERDKDIPIIALTALASRDDKRDCLDAGCTDYITKPIDPLILIDICAKYFINDSHSFENKGEKKKNVLLVSDNKTLRFFVSQILAKEGAEVETADNADTALHVFIQKKKDWHLLIVDEYLDYKNWAEFVKIIQSIRDNVKILLLIDRTDINGIQKAIRIGCESVIPKPLQYTETDKILIEVLQNSANTESTELSKENLLFTSSAHGINTPSQRIGCSSPCQKLAIFQRSFHEKGGDRVYCQRFNQHGRCGFILADVAGHDNQSALSASWLTGILEGIWRYNQDPEKLLKTISSHFDSSTEKSERHSDSRFICILAILYDCVRHRLYFANAGIPPGYLVKEGNPKNSTLIRWSGSPIGMLPGITNFEVGSFPFLPGDRLFLATDGIFESLSEEVTTKIYNSFVNNSLPETIEKISDYYIRSIPKDDDLTIAVFAADVCGVPNNGRRYTIPSTYEAIDLVMSDIDQFLEESYNDDKDRIDTFLVSTALREAILNAVEHGNQKSENKNVDIDIIPGEHSLEVLVSDEGAGFEYNQIKKDLIQNKSSSSIQGRGLDVLEQIASKLEIKGGSTRMIFDLNK